MDERLEAERILARRELYRRGNLRHLYHEGQIKILDRIESSTRQVQPILCARGSGKTYLGSGIGVSTCLRKPSRVKIATEFQTDLEEFILPNFDQVLATCPRTSLPRWKSSGSKWVFPERMGGSEIKLIGLDRKPNGLRGTHKTDLIILEEAGFISKLKHLYYSVIVPTTMHRPDCKILLPTTPPENLDHFFWVLWDLACLEGDIPIFTIYDNPLLTLERIAQIEKDMGGRETTAFQREYLCKRIAESTRQLTPEFSREKHVAAFERPAYFPFLRKYESLDSGVQHLTVQLYGVYDYPSATLYVEDELVLRGNEVLTDTIYKRTLQAEKDLGYGDPKKVSRWADNNNLILIQDLNKLGFDDESGRHWSPTSKDSVEAGVNLARRWIRSGRVKVHPRCKVTIGTLETALWNKRRDDFEVSEAYGHGDALATLIYLIRNIDTHTDPIPLTFGLDHQNQLVLNPSRQKGSTKVLKEAFFPKRKSR